MIDLSNLKTPGWQRIVAELHAPAPDDRTFLIRLVAVLAQVSGARQAVLFAVDRTESEDSTTSLAEPRPVLVWPQIGNEQPEVEAASDAKASARETAGGTQVRVFGLEKGGTGFYGDEGSKGYIVAVPIQQQPEGAAAALAQGIIVTLLVEPRSKQALQTTIAMVEVLAGYTQIHSIRQQLMRTRAAGAALDLAARLIASVNNAGGFKGASLQLVNDLSRQVRADRVALGWVKGIRSSGAVRAVAVSDTEHIDRRMAMIQKLEAAMDECLDQEQAVMYPPPPGEGPGADVALAQAITHAHRDLCAADARLKVVSLPLRQDDKVIGVVTIESTAQGAADVAGVELIQAALDLVAPVMVVRRSDDEPLHARAWTSTLKAGAWAVGPRHTAWKLVALAVLAVLVFVTFYTIPYRVDAQAEIQPRVKNIVSVPFDGVIESLTRGVEPGRTVRKGDLLAEMNTDELKLRQADALQEMLAHQKEADKDLQERPPKLAESAQALARAAQAKAKADDAALSIERARILAPIDGVIIAGDLSDKVGAAVKLGDPIFQVAPLDDMIVIARVSDRDIALIRDQNSEGEPTRGEVATRSDPSKAHGFTVERIVPLAQSKDGKNTFEVRGKLDLAAVLRPGIEGVAKLDTGRHSLLWIGTRRIKDQLRLWLWW